MTTATHDVVRYTPEPQSNGAGRPDIQPVINTPPTQGSERRGRSFIGGALDKLPPLLVVGSAATAAWLAYTHQKDLSQIPHVLQQIRDLPQQLGIPHPAPDPNHQAGK